MHWSDDLQTIKRLRDCPERGKWARSEAMDRFVEIMPKLPENLRQKGRIGPLSIAGMDEDSDELLCWMYPVDGSKFQGLLLGLTNRVKLVDTSGTIFFEGLWRDTTLDMIESRTRFYIWVEPIERKAPKVFKIGS